MGSPVKMMEFIRDNSVSVGTAEKLPKEELAQKIVIGEFHEEEAPGIY